MTKINVCSDNCNNLNEDHMKWMVEEFAFAMFFLGLLIYYCDHNSNKNKISTSNNPPYALVEVGLHDDVSSRH